MSSGRAARLVAEGAALVAILLLALTLRLEPVRSAGSVDFDLDRAFHLRMVTAVVRDGSVPAIHHLALAPDGKPVAALLPTFLYDAVAAFHALRGGSDTDADIERSALIFDALVGALIALPLYVLLRGLGLGALPALAAAWAAGVVPAHVHRTVAPWLRYDGLGTLLVTTHMTAVVTGLAAGRGRGLALATVIATISLVAAIASWRLALIIVALECLCVLAAFVSGRLNRAFLVLAASSLAAVLIASILIPYLARGPAGPFVVSHQGALVFTTLGILLLDATTGLHLQKTASGRAARIGLLAGALLITGLLGGGGHQGGIVDAVQVKLGWMNDARILRSPAELDADAFAQHADFAAARLGGVLLARTGELASPAPAHLVDADYFALVIVLAALFALGRLLPPGRVMIPPLGKLRIGDGSLRHWRGGVWPWHVTTLALVAATCLFARMKVMAAPFLAAYVGFLCAAAVAARSSGNQRQLLIDLLVPIAFLAVGYAALRGPLQSAISPFVVGGSMVAAVVVATIGLRRRRPAALLALCAAALVWTTFEARALTRVVPVRFAETTGAAIDVLASQGRAGDIVLCDWGRGYAVQTHTGLATVTDGFLESDENRLRIATFALALYAEDEMHLAAFCRRHEVRYVWVPGRRRTSLALYAGVDPTHYGTARVPTPAWRSTVYARMLERPGELRCFSPVAAVGSDRILAFEPGCSPEH